MDINIDYYELIIHPFLDGVIQGFKILWTVDEFKSAIIGIPVSIITFRIVGRIFRWGRNNDIWFGRRGGKIIYYLINSFLVWLGMKFI
jgi:hypothetical protein